MNEAELKAAIQRKVSTYSYWTIGITDDPERRKKEHEAEGKSVKYWSHWKADTEAIARAVEAYFIDKGMKGGTGGGEHPTYVYVF
jgi:predicted GIY-YIG superfamily endonuclease